MNAEVLNADNMRSVWNACGINLCQVSVFCWAHNEKHSFRMIIDANKSIYITQQHVATLMYC